MIASTIAIAEHEDTEAEKEVVKISEKGFEPTTMHLKKEDASVFFVNATSDSLLTFEIDFGARRMHCASSNLTQDGHGVLRSSKPVGPKDFALTCFPEKGKYQVKAFGVKGKKDAFIGTVEVEG